MSGSCSSQDNGCSACAPALGIYAISASASQGLVGYGCLNGETRQNIFSSSLATTSLRNCYPGVAPCSLSGEKACLVYFFSSLSQYIYKINKYGDIEIFGGIGYTKANYNLDYENPNQENANYNDHGNVSIISTLNDNGCLSTVETTTDCIFCTASSGCENECMADYACPEWGNSSSSCTQSSCSAQTDCGFMFNQQSLISSQKDLSFFYGLCQSSTSTKINLLETNQPQNCEGGKCGGAEGKQDDCWGGAGGFTLYSNNLDNPNATTAFSQKIKFRIAADKETLEKRYESVGGKVIFYTPTSNDAEEGRTPCCNSEDFEGTVHEEAGYSLSPGSKSFKDSMVCQDLTEFDNEDGPVGVGIQICYTVDQVKMID